MELRTKQRYHILIASLLVLFTLLIDLIFSLIKSNNLLYFLLDNEDQRINNNYLFVSIFLMLLILFIILIISRKMYKNDSELSLKNKELNTINKKLINLNKRYSALCTNMVNAFVYIKIVYDQEDKPIDYQVEDFNEAFEKISGIDRKTIKEENIHDIFEGFLGDDFSKMLEVCNELALKNGSTKFNRYFESLACWYDISIFSFEKGYFAIVFNNITELMVNQEELKNQKVILQENYEKMELNNRKIKQLNFELKASYNRLEEMNKTQKNVRTEILIAIVRMLALHDNYTKHHSETVAKIAENIAVRLGLSDKLVEETYLSGLVHDIGKVLVPANVLNKKGVLNEEEYTLVKKHSLLGYQTLMGFKDLEGIASYILHHHERWDGRGYPEGIAANEIPLISQIISVADAWDAMTSDRPYRKGKTYQEAICEVKSEKGKQFSPEIVDVFLNYLKEKEEFSSISRNIL